VVIGAKKMSCCGCNKKCKCDLIDFKVMQEREELIEIIKDYNCKIKALDDKLDLVVSENKTLEQRDMLLRAAYKNTKDLYQYILNIQDFLNDIDKYNMAERNRSLFFSKELPSELSERLYRLLYDTKKTIGLIDVVRRVK